MSPFTKEIKLYKNIVDNILKHFSENLDNTENELFYSKVVIY